MTKEIVTSNILSLRESSELDLDFVIETENHPDNVSFIRPWPIQKHLTALKDADITHYIVQRVADGKEIGFAILSGLQDPDQNVCLVRIVISSKGMGYGRETLRLCKRFAFHHCNAHRFWLDVKEHNIRAQQLYLSEGFVEEGTLRETLKEGDRFVSLKVMSILRDEYLGGGAQV